jgi:hypothetical protein
MQANGYLIGHRTRWAKKSGFHAKLGGHLLFQGQDSWIFSKYVVSKGCGKHGVAHPCRGLGQRIASKVNR